MSHDLNLVGWNCYTANDDDNVLAQLSAWAVRFALLLHGFALSEAASHAEALEKWAKRHGWTLLQEPPETHARRGDDTGDVAILLAPGVKVRVHWRARMRLLWMVLRYRQVHQPHVYEVTGIRIPRKRRRWLPGHLWRVEAVHWPTHGLGGENRDAWLESAHQAKRWLRRGLAPSVVVGDLNERLDVLTDWFGPKFRVFGKGIDLAVTRNVAGCEWTELGKGGGDHHGRFYRFSA